MLQSIRISSKLHKQWLLLSTLFITWLRASWPLFALWQVFFGSKLVVNWRITSRASRLNTSSSTISILFYSIGYWKIGRIEKLLLNPFRSDSTLAKLWPETESDDSLILSIDSGKIPLRMFTEILSLMHPISSSIISDKLWSLPSIIFVKFLVNLRINLPLFPWFIKEHSPKSFWTRSKLCMY